MALIRGCHIIGKGDPSLAPGIAAKIVQSKSLRINVGMWGVRAWAYYVDMVLGGRRLEPMVIFDVEEKYVAKKSNPLPHRSDFAYMVIGDPSLIDVSIDVLGFRNVPGFHDYPGAIGFV